MRTKRVTMMLVTLTAAGVLAVPAGTALAQDETPEPAVPVTTCQPERDRDRDRVNDQDQVVVQTQERAQIRLRDGTCDGDCTGDEVRDRDRVHLEDGTGLGAQHRQGGLGTLGNGRGNS
ncbi:MAG: hypothetical protein AB7Q42_17465 [Acidimicrobiia bacterium]